MIGKKYLIFLLGILALALLLRFLYFPGNIYFGFDQARDAFASLEVAHGNFRIIGPPTAIEGLYHGPLYYYIFAPFYLLSNGDPIAVSIFLRILNALGVLLVFLAGTALFNKKA